jgi:hypothetical protein
MTTTLWQYYTRNLSVETIKCRRTLVLWLAAGAPFFMVFLFFNVFLFKGHELVKPGENPWLPFQMQIMQVWALLFFPLYISLQSALYNGIEHQANTWKYVYSLAVPKWSVYGSKFTLFTALIALTMILLFGFTQAAGMLLDWLQPSLGFGRYTAYDQNARECFTMFMAALGITAIQFYVSFRFRNFILPAGLGLLMSVTTPVLMKMGWEHVNKFPYAWPMISWFKGRTEPAFLPQEVYLSLAFFALVAITGYFETARRNVE